jgi:hypothetical protein
MMDAYLITLMIAGGATLGVVVWMLAKLGKALIKIAEVLAAAAVVIFAVWLVIKGMRSACGWCPARNPKISPRPHGRWPRPGE